MSSEASFDPAPLKHRSEEFSEEFPEGSSEALQRGSHTELTEQQQKIRQKICQGHAQNRVQALPPPGNAPFGYKRGKDRYAIDRANAPIVKEFFDHFLLYGSLRGAVRYIAQKFNKAIAVSTGKHWLTNPTYRGDLAYQAVDPPQIIRDTHKAIISRDEAAQVDRLLRRNRSLPPRSASAERSLAGLVYCATCQSKMTVASVGDRGKKQKLKNPKQKDRVKSYLYLRCQTCPQPQKCRGLNYDRVLKQVIDKICNELPKAVSSQGVSQLGNIKSQIESVILAKQAMMEKIPPLVTSGILDTETADLRLYKIRTEIADLETKLSQLPPINLVAIAQTISIPQFWLDLSESERRFYFREFIRAIGVDASQKREEDWNLQLIFVF
ncbi:Recombinase [Tumidithrix helvetica PCC 7403]|uniref:recombinase family protein n=1 Tax=Tumidithrix helvetica TaxID=3457545 RepID=UPI003CA6CEA3